MKKSTKKEKMVVLKDNIERQGISTKSGQDLDQRVLYFSYGSNMCEAQLEYRVGSVVKFGVFNLPDYKLTFDCSTNVCSFANIKQSKDDIVKGVVYEMSYSQLKRLDYYEGLYKREKLPIASGRFAGRKLHIYVARYADYKEFLLPITKEYYETLLEGAKENKIEDVITKLKEINPINIVKMKKNSIREEIDFFLNNEYL